MYRPANVDHVNLCRCSCVAAWSQLTSLKVLDASYNLLVGAVPDFLPSTVQQLYLDHNTLSGNVPYKYGTMPDLRCWSLDNNPEICGVPPAGARCLAWTGTKLGR